MPARLRVAAISYLNTAPLMWDFEHGNAGGDFEVSYTLPSQCSRALEAGAADIGIIPAAAYCSVRDLAIIPDVAIASRGPVRSILLIGKCPIQEVRSVALDTSSMTSVALTKVLFANLWQRRPLFRSMEPRLDSMLEANDAALIIGDPALQLDRSKYFTVDLAEEWVRWTGKPFVFAFWAVRRDVVGDRQGELGEVFRKSRDNGLQPEHLSQITSEWAPRLGLTESAVRSYLEDNIHFYLDPPCLDGLAHFYRLAHECGALPEIPPLIFAGKLHPEQV